MGHHCQGLPLPLAVSKRQQAFYIGPSHHCRLKEAFHGLDCSLKKSRFHTLLFRTLASLANRFQPLGGILVRSGVNCRNKEWLILRKTGDEGSGRSYGDLMLPKCSGFADLPAIGIRNYPVSCQPDPENDPFISNSLHFLVFLAMYFRSAIIYYTI